MQVPVQCTYHTIPGVQSTIRYFTHYGTIVCTIKPILQPHRKYFILIILIFLLQHFLNPRMTYVKAKRSNMLIQFLMAMGTAMDSTNEEAKTTYVQPQPLMSLTMSPDIGLQQNTFNIVTIILVYPDWLGLRCVFKNS